MPRELYWHVHILSRFFCSSKHVPRISFDQWGNGKQQIGQSPRCELSGCLNKTSSRNSAARNVQITLCSGRCSFRHRSLQYLARSHLSQSFNFMPSTSALPQFVQHIMSATSVSVFSSSHMLKLYDLRALKFAQ